MDSSSPQKSADTSQETLQSPKKETKTHWSLLEPVVRTMKVFFFFLVYSKGERDRFLKMTVFPYASWSLELSLTTYRFLIFRLFNRPPFTSFGRPSSKPSNPWPCKT